ncbi:MAG TPA: hypothetical protein PKM43_11005, partial [Verrucomicrobiota bacterium]|nr:hypothetical protein [Verrucomicrobiota bacterium]
MKTTFVSGTLFCLVLSQPADLALPARADLPPAESDLIEPRAGPLPDAFGTGLRGAYWHLPPDSIDNLANRGGDKDIGLDTMSPVPPQATFLATQINYSGNDFTPLGQWLGADGSSIRVKLSGNEVGAQA